MTDLLQPVDSHVAARTKQIMASLYKIEVELNYEEWRSHQTTGALSAMNRRKLMARWLDVAWKHLIEHPHILTQAFAHTVLVKLDGTHELRYRGLPDYQPPHI